MNTLRYCLSVSTSLSSISIVNVDTRLSNIQQILVLRPAVLDILAFEAIKDSNRIRPHVSLTQLPSFDMHDSHA